MTDTSTRRLLALTLPILLENVLRSLMGTVVVLILSHVSDDAVASVGVANQIFNIVVQSLGFISIGTSIVLNLKLGAGDLREAAKIAMNAITILLGLGLIFSIGLVSLAPTLISWMGMEASLRPDAILFLRWVGGSAAFTALSTVIAVVFRCYKNARTPMLVVMLSNALNVMLCLLVVFRPFEIPLHGISGVGVVRFVVAMLEAAAMALLLWRSDYGLRIRDMLRIRMQDLKRILSLGFLTGTESICYTICQVITLGYLASFGAAAISAKVYIQSVNGYPSMIGMSLGTAMQILSGQLMGAGRMDEAYRFINKRWKYMALCNGAASLLLFAFSRPVIGWFTDNPEILQVCGTVLLIEVGCNISRTLAHSFNYGLRSAGYLTVPAAINGPLIWLFNAGLGYVFTVVCGWGIVGLWLAFLTDETVRGLSAVLLWRSRRWEKAARKHTA